MRYLSVALLICAARSEAQQLDTLYVGKAALSSAYMRNDSSTSEVIVPDSSAPNGQRVIGHSWTRQRVVQDHGAPALFRVSHFQSAKAEVTDSILTRGNGLVPAWETSHQTSKLMHLTFGGRRVTGDVTPTGKPKETIDQTMAVAPFNSSDVELLIGSLSLTLTYRALVATYEYESGGLRLDTLSVTGRDKGSWIVRISRGDSSSFTLWLDASSKHVGKMEIASHPNGWDVRIVRQ
jgi:hypothetical protein